MSESEAASELARARWKKATKEERKAVGAALAEARKKKISPERRAEIARKAVQARWRKTKAQVTDGP